MIEIRNTLEGGSQGNETEESIPAYIGQARPKIGDQEVVPSEEDSDTNRGCHTYPGEENKASTFKPR